MDVFDLKTMREERGDNFPWRVGMVSVETYEMDEFYDVEEARVPGVL